MHFFRSAPQHVIMRKDLRGPCLRVFLSSLEFRLASDASRYESRH
jgi:hypothetical protein